MYLYEFEDGTTWQLESPPTDVDFEIIDSGNLHVFTFKDGDFFKVVGPNKLEPVDTGQILIDEPTGMPYSAWSDESP